MSKLTPRTVEVTLRFVVTGGPPMRSQDTLPDDFAKMLLQDGAVLLKQTHNVIANADSTANVRYHYGDWVDADVTLDVDEEEELVNLDDEEEEIDLDDLTEEDQGMKLLRAMIFPNSPESVRYRLMHS